MRDTVRQPANYGGSAKNAVRALDRARQGEAEEDMAAILDEMPVIYERQFLYAAGRRLRADFVVWMIPHTPSAFGSLGRRRVCLVEVQGGIFSRQAHGSITGVLADITRLNLATINGWRMIRVTPEMIRDGRARELLERLLA